MKMLFSSSDTDEIKQVKKKLFEAGIPCEVRHNPIARSVFGARTCPELWVNNEGDILKALKVVGTSRLRQMTAVF
jgi:hypothetical protein